MLSLPLFTGGRLVNQVKAADLLTEAALHRLVRNREELVFNVSSIFYSILAQRQVIESLEFSTEALEGHIQRIDALVEAEKAAGADRLRTEVRIADVRQKLVHEKNIMTIHRRVLANLLGLEKDFDNISLQGELESQEEITAPELDAALSMAWASRDDYLAARSNLEAQARKVDAARAGYWPSLYIQGSYGQRWAVGPRIIGRGV
jgi:outer membrane protein TolC